MLSIPQYLIESSICLLIFYGFYHFFLQKETFFQLNRFYLLTTPFLSLLIPFWNISLKKEEVAATAFDTVIYPAMQSAQQVQAVFWEQMREPTPVFSLSVSDVIMAIYLGGVCLMAFTLMRSLWRLSRLIRRGKRQKKEGFTQVELQDQFPAASFFGYIFYNQQITDEQQLILEHEKVHIRQWHSLDVLAMELVVIIKWFNPLIYFFRNALKATHEFIADQYVIQQKTNLTTYAFLLVNANQAISSPLTNTFYSLTKERLKKMLQQPSQNWKVAKYLLVFPVILFLMSLFSFNLLEEFEIVQEGWEEMDAAFSKLGEKKVYQVDTAPSNQEDPLLAASNLKFHTNSNISAYIIQWGKIEMDFHQSLSDGSISYPHRILTKEELIENFDKPIIITKEGVEQTLKGKIQFEIFGATQEGNKTSIGDSKMGLFLTTEDKPIELMSRMPSFKNLSFDNIFISINVAELGLKSSLQVGVDRFYAVPVQVNTLPLERFSYQLLWSDKGISTLKIDTSLVANQKILAMYQDASKYQIIHIPDFETSQRLVTNGERQGALNIGPPANKILLPEYLDFFPEDLTLTLGKIIANPKKAISLEDFNRNNQSSLQLSHKELPLTIKQFQLAIYKQKEGWKSMAVTDWGAAEVKNFLSDLPKNSSIYFTQVIIETKGREYFLPQTFLVTLTKDKEALKLPNSSTGFIETASPYPTAIASVGEKKDKNQYQIQWGKYTFDCKVIIQSSRRYCDCERKYIAKEDLKPMNRSGIKFLKNGEKVKFKNVRVSAFGGQVYCKKEELMLSFDQQEKYNKKACIWNAFEEEDKASVSFQTEEFARVNFFFAINSNAANDPIVPIQIVLGTENILINPMSRKIEDGNISFGQAKRILKEQAYVEYFGKQMKIDEVKFDNRARLFTNYPSNGTTFFLMSDKKDVALLNQKIPEDQLFQIFLSTKDDKTELILFSLSRNKNGLDIPIPYSSWGSHTFNWKDSYLSISKQEIKNLLQHHAILTSSGEKFKTIENFQFQFRHRPNVRCTVNGTLENIKNDPCINQHIAELQHGDIVQLNSLKGPLQTSWLTVIIQEDQHPTEDIIIQKSKQEQPSLLFDFEANGKHLFKQGVDIKDLIKELLQSRHGKLEVAGKTIPNLDVFFHSKDSNLSKEEIYDRILQELKRKYSLTIKTKYQEQTGWFLSGGDPEKLNQFTEEKVQPNLEYFNEQARNKGLEPVGPMNYNWLADRYLELEHGIKVTDLTEFSGRYILPLKTKDLKSLQKQLKKDYGLILKQQKRTIPITVVRFEKEDQ